MTPRERVRFGFEAAEEGGAVWDTKEPETKENPASDAKAQTAPPATRLRQQIA